MVTIPKSEIFDLCQRAFNNVGIKDDKAIETICNHLMYNEMSGKQSHGLLRIKWHIDAIKNKGVPHAPPSADLDLGALAIINGNNNIGLVAAEYGANTAIEKAKSHGISFVGVRNHFGTTGTMNYYNGLFVKHGLVGIAGCNSEALVCHPDGYDPVIGTNPISFGIPSKNTPCIVDITTAQWAYGKLLQLHKSGQDLPVDAIVDKDGKTSQNIKDAMNGAMLPMNGYKGFSIGLAIEILSGALIGAKSGRSAIDGSDGIFFIAINPDMLVGQDQFEEHVEALLQEIKSSRHDAQISEILIPGERSSNALINANNSDDIEIIDNVYQDLKDLAK